MLSGLLADTFGIRARASGYEFSDRAVTIADADARADVALRAAARPGPAPGCAFTVTPASLSFSKGGVSDTFGSRISVGAAQDAWTATADAGWVLLFYNGVRDVQAVSGSGPATVAVSVNIRRAIPAHQVMALLRVANGKEARIHALNVGDFGAKTLRSWDYQNLRVVPQAALRRMIAYVPQDPSMFHRTIADNIRVGLPEATDADLRRAAVCACRRVHRDAAGRLRDAGRLTLA